MQTLHIASANLDVSRIGFGCMRLPADRAAALQCIRTALDEGINFFDHADVYGRGQREETFSALWREAPGLRAKVYVQSKCGVCMAGDPRPTSPKRYDFSYSHIIEAVEGSLRRLKTDYLDILLLHRPDPLVEPEEVARAFTELETAGKVRHFGVSNHTGAQIDLLRSAVRQPLVVNQMQVSLLHNTLINAGVITNQDLPPAPVRGEGTLEYCRLHGITIQPWGPLATGWLTGRPGQPPDERAAAGSAMVETVAREHRCSKETILIAWLLRHPARMQPIIGTMNMERIRACCAADGLELTREEWYRLFNAARGGDVP